MDPNRIDRLAVLGAGTMGRGIATVAALAGYGIALRDVSEALVEEGYDGVGASLDRLVDSDRLDAEAAAAARDRMTPVVDLDAAVGDADLVVEALPERMDLKRDVYAETCSRLPDDALLVTNTSSLSITDLGAATDRSARFCGMHFFNPPVRMDLVEVIAGAETADETLAAVESVAREMDKTPVRVRNDSPGFVVNRVLLPTLNEAAWLVNDGVASVETVDATATAGLDLPTGAFELADYVGIDVVVDVVLRVRRRRADPRRRSGPDGPPTAPRRRRERDRAPRRRGRGRRRRRGHGAPARRQLPDWPGGDGRRLRCRPASRSRRVRSATPRRARTPPGESRRSGPTASRRSRAGSSTARNPTGFGRRRRRTTVRVPLGDGTVDVTLPACEVTAAEPAGRDPVDPDRAASRAVRDPHGRPIADRVGDDDAVAVVVTDVTRETPTRSLLDALLGAAGLRDPIDAADRLTIVLGLGLHRAMTDAEVERALGPYAPHAVNHDPDAAVRVGTVDGVPVAVHPAIAAADTVLSTGLVEPHQYAGFSGGAKTVVVGAGGEAVIDHTHGPGLIGRDGVRLGRIDDNPFRSFLDRAGDVVGIDACLNVTRTPDGVVDAAAGDPRPVVRDLAATARDALAVPVDGQYDAVVAGVGAPKDATLYQASRAATYVALGPRNPLVRGSPDRGGRIVVPATLSEGAGTGRGERRFHEWLRGADDPASLYGAMRDGYEPGAQRAFVLARVLRTHDVWITNSDRPDVAAACLLRTAPTVADAVEPGSDVLVVPDALHTLLR